MNWQEHIVLDKQTLLGKPTIKGTRIYVEHVAALFAQGWSEEQILQNFPRLTKQDLNAVSEYLRENPTLSS